VCARHVLAHPTVPQVESHQTPEASEWGWVADIGLRNVTVSRTQQLDWVGGRMAMSDIRGPATEGLWMEFKVQCVASLGFEPAISTLAGLHVRPLHQASNV
jgi:hypothetical protein